MMRGTFPLLSALPLWMNFGGVAALAEPEICYVLDSILFLYAIILTILYCRVRHANHVIAVDLGIVPGKTTAQRQKEKEQKENKRKQKAEESIYTGLTPHGQDTYETIGQKKGLQ